MDPAGSIPEPVASVSSQQTDPAPCLRRAAPVTSRSDMRRFSRRSWIGNRHALPDAIVVAAILGPPVGAGPGRATDHRIDPGRGRERHDPRPRGERDERGCVGILARRPQGDRGSRGQPSSRKG